jgi:NADH dehydrogenase
LLIIRSGIKQTPLAESLVESLPREIQKNSKALLTDNRLHVKGIRDGSVFAIGDCSSVDYPRMLSNLVKLFKEADTDKNGTVGK